MVVILYFSVTWIHNYQLQVIFFWCFLSTNMSVSPSNALAYFHLISKVNWHKTNKNSLYNSKMAKYYSIFCPNAIQYLLQYWLRGWKLWPWIITFLLCLLYDLGYRGLLFALTMNLKAGPHCARICIALKCNHLLYGLGISWAWKSDSYRNWTKPGLFAVSSYLQIV